MSGRRLNLLLLENSGNVRSKLPTFVVVKAPSDVSHLHGRNLSSLRMSFRTFLFTKTRSPSEPESNNTRQALLGFLSDFRMGTASTAALTPSPSTILLFAESDLLSAILIGGLVIPVNIGVEILLDATLNFKFLLFTGLLFRLSQGPLSYSLMEERELSSEES